MHGGGRKQFLGTMTNKAGLLLEERERERKNFRELGPTDGPVIDETRTEGQRKKKNCWLL